jgi:DNA-binding transcriptional ArsR family regulator
MIIGSGFVIENAKNIAELLKVLANENRLLIVCNLMESSMTVSELHQRMDKLTQSALSQHLAILKAHKILSSDKNGLSITYSIHDDRIRNIIMSLKENYCEL